MGATPWAVALLMAGVLDSVPATPDPKTRYLIYVHGRIIEEQGRQAVSLEERVFAGFDAVEQLKPCVPSILLIFRERRST